jgi:hypothetical protein
VANVVVEDLFLSVDRNDAAPIVVPVKHDLVGGSASTPEGLAAAVAITLRGVTKRRGEVRLVAAGALPNDGKVIADERRVA